MSKITSIEGIGASYASKLKAEGISTTEDLLARCATGSGRSEIAEKTGISGKLILRWANMADLFRVRGVSEEYAELLEAAGVDSVPELSQRNADHLHEKLKEANEAKKLVRRVPGRDQVAGWIDQAQSMPRTLTY